ncbi:MAG: RidA family protein [Burkholderiales bacterium]|jgi:enamine deaminase RidA (YjgF/YER057c/UK114 family)|nr:RidA family protein [Burkholderiales bacterium]
MSTIVRHPSGPKLSDAVEYNGVCYLAGMVASDETLDTKGQTEQVLADIDRALAACGTNKSKILSATCYISDMRNKPGMDEAWLAWVDPKNLPARATVQVGLGNPTTLIEIMVIAAK